MAANIDPIYSRIGDVQWIGAVTAANNILNIATGTSYLVYTADATYGGFVSYVRVKADPANNTAATVVRLWLNNGLTLATAANSSFLTEMTIAATVASATAANPDYNIPLNIALPPGYRIYATLATAAGGSGQFSITALGGKY